MASLIKRGRTYQMQWYEGEKKRRVSLKTDSLQIANEKLRQFESARYRGDTCPLPTKTPIGQVVSAFIAHMKAHRPESSWSKDVSYLREMFGECCPELELSSKRARRCKQIRCPEDRRKKLHPISAPYFEEITTGAISNYIAGRVRILGNAPKTANRYREVICKLFNWAISTEMVRMPLDRNPAAKVERYREPAPEIRYLTLTQIEEQLEALRVEPQLRVMVAVLIYAGLRREELLWLRREDLIPPSTQSPGGLIRVQAKTIDGETWQPKTRRNRVVPISRALRQYLDGRTPLAKESGWAFPSPRGTRWDKNNFSDALRRANEAAGLGWSCLDFRHTFGSQLAQKGVSLFQISTLMGNSPEICRRHYASVSTESLVQSVCF